MRGSARSADVQRSGSCAAKSSAECMPLAHLERRQGRVDVEVGIVTGMRVRETDGDEAMAQDGRRAGMRIRKAQQ